MRAVALVSGGKDSCYNMMQCIAAGHTIVALANLQPQHKDELDSYMYQTVGHQGIELYSEAMGLPLYRAFTKGVAIVKNKDYKPTAEDEVEDLYDLLLKIKEEIHIEAVAVGAILSDYQRIRVENVCSRLGLVSLAYLWRRNQVELLQEMITSGLDAVIIKVASLGLDPGLHLGKSIRELQPHLLLMQEKYGLNPCGEGGEYETFTLDCPLFNNKIVIDETQQIVHSDDVIAPVGYLNFISLHLESKANSNDGPITLPPTVKTSFDFVNDVNESVYSDISDIELSETELETIEKLEKDETDQHDIEKIVTQTDSIVLDSSKSMEVTESDTTAESDLTDYRESRIRTESEDFRGFTSSPNKELNYECEQLDIEDNSCIFGNTTGWYFIGGIVGEGTDSEVAMGVAMDKLSNLLKSENVNLEDICSVNMYVRDMADYVEINRAYSRYINFLNPPTRVCVQCPLPAQISVILDAVAYRPVMSVKAISDCGESTNLLPAERNTLHVQGISHWAPANIGPYSQAVKVGEIIGVCGQIALVPGAMQLVQGGSRRQCALALRHVGRVLRAADRRAHIRSVVQGICYVTSGSAVAGARRQWERRTAGAIVDYVVVPALPRDAALEWHVWAHTANNRFDYEETGCNVGEYKVAIRRRWNYENTVAAIVAYIATGSSPSTSQLSFPNEEAFMQHRKLAKDMSKLDILDVLQYSIQKLLDECQAKEQAPAVSLRLFYQVSVAPPVTSIIQALKEARDKFCTKLAFTVVPVVKLQNAFTFISICGMRHESD